MSFAGIAARCSLTAHVDFRVSIDGCCFVSTSKQKSATVFASRSLWGWESETEWQPSTQAARVSLSRRPKVVGTQVGKKCCYRVTSTELPMGQGKLGWRLSPRGPKVMGTRKSDKNSLTKSGVAVWRGSKLGPLRAAGGRRLRVQLGVHCCGTVYHICIVQYRNIMLP